MKAGSRQIAAGRSKMKRGRGETARRGKKSEDGGQRSEGVEKDVRGQNGFIRELVNPLKALKSLKSFTRLTVYRLPK